MPEQEHEVDGRGSGKSSGVRDALVRMTRRGAVTLPTAIRKELPEDVLFEVVRREDGVIELRPKVTIDASHAWFWTEKWQQMEREADKDAAAGRYKTFDTGEEFLAHLRQLAAESEAERAE